MGTERDVVDYALQRRAVLADVTTGRRSVAEACDAHPYLLLAARHYGHPVTAPCPVCAKRGQTHVSYVFGDALGPKSGQAKNDDELTLLAATHDEFDVYVVEVCADCGWNSLIRTYVLGRPAGPRRSMADG